MVRLIIPLKGDVLSYELHHRHYNLREFLNKASIEIHKADETLYPFYGLRGFPLENSLYLIRVYSDALLYFHDKSEVFRRLYLELVFIDVNLESYLS